MSDVGRLRERVVLQSVSYASSTQSSQGVKSFSTLATVWARVTSPGGDESITAGSVSSQVRYEVEMRYRADVTPAMRVVWTPKGGSAKTLEVLAVNPSRTFEDRIVLQCGASA
jgi:SPP1 family predicted phage head-tail adaptor